MLKYLRIAVTGLSLTACVFLIALWVRSWQDYMPRPNSHYSLEVVASHWILILAFAIFAAMPWIRFSLRTLLIATTLVAVVLGLLAIARLNSAMHPDYRKALLAVLAHLDQLATDADSHPG